MAGAEDDPAITIARQPRTPLPRSYRYWDAVLWALAGLALGATLLYSLVTAPPGANAFPIADKLLHAGCYVVVTGLLLLAAVWRPGRGDGAFPQAGDVIVGAIVACGIAIEVLQGGFFHRTADPRDAVANLAGALVAYLAWRGVRSRSL
jgi:VanZ family protein